MVATHLNHLIGQFSAELFGRQEAQQLLDRVTQEMPKLTEDLVPGVLTLTTLHKVLQNLLDDPFAICVRERNARTPLDALPSNGSREPAKCRSLAGYAAGTAAASGVAGRWRAGAGSGGQITGANPEALARQEMLGAPPVLLVNHALRPLLSRFLRRSLNQLVVLSNMELSDNRNIRMTATIGGK